MLLDLIIGIGIFISGAAFGTALIIALCGKTDGKDNKT